MINDIKLVEGFKAYKKACEIESKETTAPFYTGSLSYGFGKELTYSQFLVRVSNDMEFGRKWININHFEQDSPYKDFSIEQRNMLESILKDTFIKGEFWSLNSREQVYYLITNAIASWSNYNPLYFLSRSAEKIIEQKKINVTKPVSRHSLFQIRDDSKRKLLVFEHAVPVTVQLALIKYAYENNKYSFLGRLTEILHLCGAVCVITKIEDNKLKKLKLNNSMGEVIKDVNSISVWSRYEKAGINVTSNLLEVYGKMYR